MKRKENNLTIILLIILCLLCILTLIINYDYNIDRLISKIALYITISFAAISFTITTYKWFKDKTWKNAIIILSYFFIPSLVIMMFYIVYIIVGAINHVN